MLEKIKLFGGIAGLITAAFLVWDRWQMRSTAGVGDGNKEIWDPRRIHLHHKSRS